LQNLRVPESPGSQCPLCIGARVISSIEASSLRSNIH
jgi:hypothetical protein